MVGQLSRVISAIVSAFVLKIVLGLPPLAVALVFGGIASLTDPVSVVNFLKRVRAPERLTTILETQAYFQQCDSCHLVPYRNLPLLQPTAGPESARLHSGGGSGRRPHSVRNR